MSLVRKAEALFTECFEGDPESDLAQGLIRGISMVNAQAPTGEQELQEAYDAAKKYIAGVRFIEQQKAHEKGEPCEEQECQECCEHQEHDHFICIDCGKEGEPSDYYDEDYGSDR